MSIKYNNKTIAGYYKTEIIPNADTVNAGKIRIATQAEVDSGESNSTAVTPSYLNKKQDKLTAGKNITIENGVISADTTTGINVDGETISNENAVLSSIGTKTKSNTIKIDWEGTEAEYEAGLADGTISNDWYCYITDDETVVDFADHTELEVQNMYKTGNVSTDTTGYNQLVEMKSSGNKTGIDTVKIGGETVEIPYTLSKTGSKIVDVAYRNKVQALYNQEGKADYYTIDETNQNFTLPMGEIYGMKANSDLSNLTTAGEKHFLNKSQITNCLLEVPQRIKLKLNDGVLTLKAGSQVIMPNGFEADGTAPKFDYVEIENDLTYTVNNNQQTILFIDNNKNITARAKIWSFSGKQPSGLQYMAWYDNATNLMKFSQDNGSTWISGYSLPLALFTANATQIISLDQVFNGIGYIGSTVWVDKGVKGLASNGRNADGSLINEEVITDKLTISTITDTVTRNRNININRNGVWTNASPLTYYQSTPPDIITNDYQLWFNEAENVWYEHIAKTDTWIVLENIQLQVGICAWDSSSKKITSFTPKLPFRALDYSDKTKITNWSFPSDKYIDLTLGASGTTYTAPADGWVVQDGLTKSTALHQMGAYNQSAGVNLGMKVIMINANNTYLTAYTPCSKGDKFQATYSTTYKNHRLRFYYAKGSEPTV